MATNKNALIRYRTIDKCLQNRQRRWTLVDLIDTCSDALYEYEGKPTLVSKRTVQLDIQTMRSEKLGYNAPIICYDKKYYVYEDPNYTITDIPLTTTDMEVLSETMLMLRQFKDFSLFRDMDGIIQKLEDKIHSSGKQETAIIHLEKNEKLKGLQFLDTLYQAILKEVVLVISYQSFNARQKSAMTIHPYLLKEFNNRWFLIGRKEGQDKLMTLALDRIISIDMNLDLRYDKRDFDADRHFEHTIGVTVLSDTDLIDIHFTADRKNAPYIITKPFHHSQEITEHHDDGRVSFRMRVHHNFEVERLILGFGEGLVVNSPRKLKGRIKSKLRRALELYSA